MARFNGGWIKLHKKLMSSDIIQNQNCFLVWVWLLTNANYKKSQAIFCGEQRTLTPGMILFGIKEVADFWSISRSTVHKWLHYLASSERITIEVRTHGCIATILNWETYQGSEDIERTEVEQQANTSRTPAEREPTLNEEYKNIRKEVAQKNSRKSLIKVEGVNLLIAHYVDEFRKRYAEQGDPPLIGREQGAAKTLVKDLGLERAKTLVTDYLKNGDKRFVDRKHDLCTLLNNVNAVAIKPQKKYGVPPPQIISQLTEMAEQTQMTFTPEKLAELKKAMKIKGMPGDDGPKGAA